MYSLGHHLYFIFVIKQTLALNWIWLLTFLDFFLLICPFWNPGLSSYISYIFAWRGGGGIKKKITLSTWVKIVLHPEMWGIDLNDHKAQAVNLHYGWDFMSIKIRLTDNLLFIRLLLSICLRNIRILLLNIELWSTCSVICMFLPYI